MIARLLLRAGVLLALVVLLAIALGVDYPEHSAVALDALAVACVATALIVSRRYRP